MNSRERRALRMITADALSTVVAIPADQRAYWQALDTLHTARSHRRALINSKGSNR